MFLFTIQILEKVSLECSRRISCVWSVGKHGGKHSFPIGVDQKETKDRPENENEHWKVDQKGEMKKESEWEIIE